MIDVNNDTLSKYRAKDQIYSHTNGCLETKSQFLSTVENGIVDYVSATPKDVQIRIHNDFFTVTGHADIRNSINERPVSLTIRFMEVSSSVAGTWQLVAWQSVNYTAY